MARKTDQKNTSRPTSAGSKSKADPDPRALHVGQQLRSVYAETLAERVPDSFEDLLKRLS